MRKGDGARATLTRGGPHAGRPELPQDEALLALGQRQQQLVGFDALLAATEAQAASARLGGADGLATAPGLPLAPSCRRGNARGRAGHVCCAVPPAF